MAFSLLDTADDTEVSVSKHIDWVQMSVVTDIGTIQEVDEPLVSKGLGQ